MGLSFEETVENSPSFKNALHNAEVSLIFFVKESLISKEGISSCCAVLYIIYNILLLYTTTMC